MPIKKGDSEAGKRLKTLQGTHGAHGTSHPGDPHWPKNLNEIRQGLRMRLAQYLTKEGTLSASETKALVEMSKEFRALRATMKHEKEMLKVRKREEEL